MALDDDDKKWLLKTFASKSEVRAAIGTLELFKKVGAEGGRIRAKRMTAAERSAASSKAARVRWGKRKARS